jgi:hypothetical protein
MNPYRLIRRADRWLDRHPTLRDVATVAILTLLVLCALYCAVVKE